jgi:hypothetical protein
VYWNNYSFVGPKGDTGDTGPKGDTGDTGTNGNTILYGSVAPTTEGVNGDFFVNTVTNFLYGPKSGGVWPSGTSLVGPQGVIGPTGPTGAFSPLAAGYFRNTTTVTHTGTLANTKLISIRIPANTFSSGNSFDILTRMQINGSLFTTIFIRAYIHTSDTLGGATVLVNTSMGSGNVFSLIQRNILIKSPTSTLVFNTLPTINLDISVNAYAHTNLNTDWTVDQYIIIAVTLANTSTSIDHLGTFITPRG